MALESISEKIQQKIKQQTEGEVNPTTITDALFSLQEQPANTKQEQNTISQKIDSLREAAQSVYSGEMLDDFIRATEQVEQQKKKESNQSMARGLASKASQAFDASLVINAFVNSSPLMSMAVGGIKSKITDVMNERKEKKEELSSFKKDIQSGVQEENESLTQDSTVDSNDLESLTSNTEENESLTQDSNTQKTSSIIEDSISPEQQPEAAPTQAAEGMGEGVESRQGQQSGFGQQGELFYDTTNNNSTLNLQQNHEGDKLDEIEQKKEKSEKLGDFRQDTIGESEEQTELLEKIEENTRDMEGGGGTAIVGGLGKLAAPLMMAQKAIGGVGLAAGAGAAVGTGISKGWEAILTKATGKETSIGTGLYDLFGKDQGDFAIEQGEESGAVKDGWFGGPEIADKEALNKMNAGQIGQLIESGQFNEEDTETLKEAKKKKIQELGQNNSDEGKPATKPDSGEQGEVKPDQDKSWNYTVEGSMTEEQKQAVRGEEVKPVPDSGEQGKVKPDSIAAMNTKELAGEDVSQRAEQQKGSPAPSTDKRATQGDPSGQQQPIPVPSGGSGGKTGVPDPKGRNDTLQKAFDQDILGYV